LSKNRDDAELAVAFWVKALQAFEKRASDKPLQEAVFKVRIASKDKASRSLKAERTREYVSISKIGTTP